MPKRSEQGLLLRRCFLPEEGERWYSADFSQQEPRLTVHYAAITTINGESLPGAQEAVDKYVQDPKLSYHKMVAEQTGLDYESAKTLNLALLYGMGSEKAAKKLKVTVDKAKEYIAQYHQRLPFVKALDGILKNKVISTGEFKTIMRPRMCRFPCTSWRISRKLANAPFRGESSRLFGQVNSARVALRKVESFDSGLSGGPDQKAVDVWAAGLGSHIFYRCDELCFSFADQICRTRHLMGTTITLKVPVIAEVK